MAGFLGANAYWQKSMNPFFGDQIMGNPWKSQLLMVKSACLCWLHHLQWPCASSYWNLQKKNDSLWLGQLSSFSMFSHPQVSIRACGQPGCASRPRRHRSTDSSVLVATNVIKAIVRHPQFSHLYGCFKSSKYGWFMTLLYQHWLYIYTVLCTTIYTILFFAYWHIRYNEI